MFRIFTIAGNTFTEVIRQPVYLIILFCAFALLLASPYTTWFVMLENAKLIKDMGLSTILLTGLLIGAFSSANVIHKEIENRTVLTIISKPIRRSSFLLGKYLGVFLGILVVEYLLSLVLLQVVRTEITEAAYSKTDYPVLFSYLFSMGFVLLLGAYANYFYEKAFTSSVVLFSVLVFSVVFFALCLIGPKWKIQPFGANLDVNVFLAILLICMSTALLSAVAVAASTRFSPAYTLAICLLFFLIGLLSDYFFGRHSESYFLAKALYMIIPNLQVYLVGDAIMQGRSIPLVYLWDVLIYTFFYLSGILALAIALFQERET